MEGISTGLGTEEQIMAAAIAVFQRDGFNGARMQDIADTAGINKALLHYYFRSKEKLFQAVFSVLFGHVIKELFEVLNMDKPLFEKIRLFYDRHISFIMKNPYLPGFILGELNHNPGLLIEVMKSKNAGGAINVFNAQVKDEIAAGRIKDIAPLQILTNMMAASVFPFGARGLLTGIYNLNDEDFNSFVEERKSLCADMIIAWIERKE